MWLFQLPRRILRLIERLARNENASEVEIVERAMAVLKEQISRRNVPEVSTDKEDTIYIRALSRRLPVSKAKELAQEIGRYFGSIGLQRMTPEQRQTRAKAAAAARWGKRRGKKKPE